MRTRLSVFLALVLALAPLTVASQERGTIAGRVVEVASEQPLPGVLVGVKNTNISAITDAQGRYTLENVPTATVDVRATRLGYQPAEKKVTVTAGAQTVNFQMAPDALGLDEIVVIGYGETRRRNATGAIASIRPETLEDIPTPTIDNVLQGRMAGVQVVQNSGVPGAAISVRVRGASSISAGNQPLYVIDGVPLIQGNFSSIDNQFGGQGVDALADLNPNEIQSIEVLKDASAAAIYGSRASNGVVLITTKRGQANERPQVKFNTYYGIQRPWNIPEFTNAGQYVQLYEEAWANDGLDSATGGGFFDYFGVEVDPAVDTDWFDAVFEPAPMSEVFGSINGGNERARYFVSGTRFSQDGIVEGYGFERLNGRVNLDYSASDRLTLGTSVALTRSVIDRARGDNTIYGPFANALASAPVDRVRDEAGEFNLGTAFYDNPVALGALNRAEERTFHVLGNAFARYELVQGLNAKVNFGLDQYSLRSYLYDSPIVGPAVGSGGAGEVGNAYVTKVLAEGTLDWQRYFGDDHLFSGVVGTSYEDNDFERNSVQGNTFPTSQFRHLVSAASIVGGTGTVTEYGLQSFFGRASYTFNDELTTTFNVRADGSSRFGENNRWGVFPSASVLWRLGDRPFLQDQDVISDLAFRASYGRTGNQEGLGNFDALGLFEGGFNYRSAPGIAPVQLANPDLSWEKTDQLNVGGEIAFFNDRLFIGGDWYRKETTDLLLERPVPYTTGFAVLTQNIGALENTGVELSVRGNLAQSLENGGFNWTSELNVSSNRNRVTALYNDEPINVASVGPVRIEEGEPLGFFYGYKTAGLFRTEDEICHDSPGECLARGLAFQSEGTTLGDIRFVDINNDGVINADDRTMIGNPWPEFQGGWTNSLSFRGFDLMVFTQFSQGNDIFAAQRIYTDAFYGDKLSARLLDRFSAENPDGTAPRATVLDPNSNNRNSDRFVEDGSYVRIKNAVLGYSVPEKLAGRMGFGTLRVYVQSQNLATWTDYEGFDPEVNYSGEGLSRGVDFYTLPQARTFSVGLNVGF